jgi:hypothetical protein
MELLEHRSLSFTWGTARRLNAISASRMVIDAMSASAIVTRRNRSDYAPTRPSAHEEVPTSATVSTRMGSLKRGPIRVWPTRKGGVVLFMVVVA